MYWSCCTSFPPKLKEPDWKIRSTKVDAGNLKHELLNRLWSTLAVNVLINILQFSFQCHMQWNLGSRTPLFTNNSVHEQIFWAKKSRMTNSVSDYEHASWQQRLATSIEYRRGSVSCWLTLAQYISLLKFAVPSLEFHCVLCFLNIIWNKTPWDQRRIMNKESLAARACTILRTGLLTCVT
jgi:hypothetical protein